MQGQCTIVIDGKPYGVLVRDGKYNRHYRLSTKPIMRQTFNHTDELLVALQRSDVMKQTLLAGETIAL